MARALALMAAGLVLLTGTAIWAWRSHTGSPAPSAGASRPPTAPAAPTPEPSPTPAPSHVFVIVLENRAYDQALQSPYLGALAQQYALLTNYRALTSPSLPNYLALTSGSTWGVTDDSYHVLPAGGLGTQLTDAGVGWKAYFEGFNGDCKQSPYPYALKHNPFAYYGDGCPSNVVPVTELAGDLAAGSPRLSWITPGLCNDGHDCPSATADAWLQSVVPQIVSSPSWQQNGSLFITFDEGAGPADEHVATLVIAPDLKAHTSAAAYDHYSLLATIEDRLGVTRLGSAQDAHPITDVFGGGTTPPA